MWHKRVVQDGIDSLSDALLSVVETLKPMVKIDPAVLDEIERRISNSTRPHLLLHCGAVHMTSPTMSVRNDHDILDAKLVDSDEQATHDTAERMENDPSGVFDELRIAVLNAQGGRQKLSETRVHTGQDGEFLVGIFACYVTFIAFIGHKTLVEG